MQAVAAGLIVVGLLWVLGFGWAHFRAVAKAKAAESWPSAIGKVVSCEVIEEESRDREGGTTTWYNPVVTYTYAAAGGEHSGQRLRFGNYRSASRKKAEAAMARYQPGASAPVRYNPDKPQECVLETSKPGPIYLVMSVFGLLFVGVGIFFATAA